MCSNYQPVTRFDRLLTFFDVERGADEAPMETWPTGLAPFIRRIQQPGKLHAFPAPLAPRPVKAAKEKPLPKLGGMPDDEPGLF